MLFTITLDHMYLVFGWQNRFLCTHKTHTGQTQDGLNNHKLKMAVTSFYRMLSEDFLLDD